MRGCLLAMTATLTLFATTCAFHTGDLPKRPFDAELWRQAEKTEDPIRLAMVDWLMLSRRLDGLTRTEVTDLLGPPSDAPYFRDWHMIYWLGPNRGLFRIDSEWLAIRLGPDERVAEYQVIAD